MRTVIAFAVLLGVFVTHAHESVYLHTHGNDGSVTQQTVNINNVDHVASVNINAGQQSSSTVMDYDNNIIGYRLFAKKSCYVAKMNRAKMPALNQISKLAQDAKDKKQIAPPHGMQYTVSQTPVKNQASLGKSIDMLCRGVPTYWAHETEGTNLFFSASGCVSIRLIFFDVSLCGGLAF
ncbi:gastrokine-1-like [Latimeria chalumnae]|uniref:gastrokine-1-like n=1 Tax=Latimeria chalumnae TaxID=7897 RepID=UPI0003C14C82|nr:PREDICTED: gastrokine-1-like [Latimeria chalumnae]|eukprot:XP_006014022.1 PREDICTED: gastrokine-1-like [Latimeria chalumnae]